MPAQTPYTAPLSSAYVLEKERVILLLQVEDARVGDRVCFETLIALMSHSDSRAFSVNEKAELHSRQKHDKKPHATTGILIDLSAPTRPSADNWHGGSSYHVAT